MKHLKFLLSLAVAMMIIVPVLAQDDAAADDTAAVEEAAAWTVTGSASFVLKNNTVYDKGSYIDDDNDDQNNEPTSSTFVDDVIVDVTLTNGGDITPYLRLDYEKGDENRMFLGVKFTKGNFSGDVNTVWKQDEDFDGVDAANVTYTMDKMAFTWNKGGVYGADDSFKVAYTVSDTLSVSLLIADSAVEDYDYAAMKAAGDWDISGMSANIMDAANVYDTGLTTTPLVQLAATLKAGVITVDFETAAAYAYVQDVKQNTEDNSTIDDPDLAGEGFYFFYVKPTLTLAPSDGMSVKVYAEYGLNLDTFGDDQGVNDSQEPNEVAIVTFDGGSFSNTTSYEVGLTVKAMGITIDGYYNAIEHAYFKQEAIEDYVDAMADFQDATDQQQWEISPDTKMEVSVAYDLKVGEMTVTPKVAYVDNMVNYLGVEEADEIGVSVATAVSF